MPAFDRIFLDPTAEDLVATMVEAVETANKRCRKGLLKPDEAVFRKMAKNVLAKPEGVERRSKAPGKGTVQGSGARATLLGVAWWTDPVGRRHVRIVGRRLLPFSEFHLNRFGPPDATTPPLALIDPEHCFVRHRPRGKPELLVGCECGAFGTPAELVWTGGRCGPCHDYEQENGRPRAQRPFVIARHADSVVGVAFTTSGEGLVSAGQDGVVDVGDPWKHEKRRGVKVLSSAHDWSPVSFACDGRIVAISSTMEHLYLVSAESGERIHGWRQASDDGCSQVALSADGSRLVGADGQHLEVWDISQPDRPVNLATGTGQSTSLALSPDGKWLATAAYYESFGIGLFIPEAPDGTMAVYEAANLRRPRWHSNLRSLSVAFAPDGDTLAAGVTNPQAVQLLEASSGRVRQTLPVSAPVRSLAFTADGRYLAAGADRTIHFWNMQTGDALGGLEGHLGNIKALAFAPDGNLLASGGADGLVRLWYWRELLA